MSCTKQVIVIRKDLNMRKGKMVAQGAHESMSAILNLMWNSPELDSLVLHVNEYPSAIKDWLFGSFTKICVSVDSEEELLQIHEYAYRCGLPTALIQDSGQTEFNDVPTYTAVAIGPGYCDKIDTITGHLKLL